MTICARSWGAGENAVGVAGLAVGETVCALKSKSCRKMIKFGLRHRIGRQLRQQQHGGKADQQAQQWQADGVSAAHSHALDFRE